MQILAVSGGRSQYRLQPHVALWGADREWGGHIWTPDACQYRGKKPGTQGPGSNSADVKPSGLKKSD